MEHSTTPYSIPNKHRLIFFDGDCNLCQFSVQFILQRDKKGRYLFASLQSDIAQQLLSGAAAFSPALATFIYWEDGRLYYRSTAALKIARGMSGIWPLLYVFIIVPAFIRDGIYNWIAANRYRWWGKATQCLVPKPAWKNRFPETLAELGISK